MKSKSVDSLVERRVRLYLTVVQFNLYFLKCNDVNCLIQKGSVKWALEGGGGAGGIVRPGQQILSVG